MKTLKNVFSLLLLTMVFLACEEPVGPGDPNGRYGSDPIEQEFGDWADKYGDDAQNDNSIDNTNFVDQKDPAQ